MRLLILTFLLVVNQVFADDLVVPARFKASVYHEGLGATVRHITVRENGDLYLKINEGGIIALRDTDGDGLPNKIARFSDFPGTGIHWKAPYLYASSDREVFRFKIQADEFVPSAKPELIVTGFQRQGSHSAKSITLDDAGNLYVNAGAPSNACQIKQRTPGAPGQEPCPQLKDSGGIWKYDANKLNQRHLEDGKRYATGLRNSVALEWDAISKSLYAVPHGRDQLSQLFPKFYDLKASAELPSEEFHRLFQNSNAGWPYTYFDHLQNARMLAPEYGGDGKKKAPKGKYQDPLIGFPGHWAPNDLLFYSGELFPAKYKGGAFIAFHGSWNRAPYPQQGYKVVFVPMKNGRPTGLYETFADGFSQKPDLSSPAEAVYRPMGLAQAPDGSLYISDSRKGRIWKITYL